MNYVYPILAAIGGAFLGMVVMALLAMGHSDDFYQAGYADGHTDGFKDGVKSVDVNGH